MLSALLLVIAMSGSAQDADAPQCPPGTIFAGTRDEDTGTEIITHVICQDVATPKPAEAQSEGGCTAAKEQAQRDRDAIERLRATGEHNQEELSRWTSMNKDAQKDALMAAVHFAADSYTADLEESASSLGKLERRVAELDKKATFSKRQATRLNYLVRLHNAEAELTMPAARFYSKALVENASSAETAWNVARDTMHHEFRVAAKRDESIRQLLQDPGAKAALAGDDDDSPGHEVVSSLVDQALNDVAEAQSTAEHFAKFTGPTIRAAVFVRDASYSAVASLLSTNRVVQDSDVAGQLAKASGVLQAQYQHSIDALNACRSN